MASFQWPPEGQVPVYPNQASLPALAGDGSVAVTLDTDTIWVFNLGSLMWLPIGGASVPLAVGTMDSQSKSANGGVIALNQLFFQTANASFPGLVSTGVQTFAGNKTFTGSIGASNLSGTNSGDVSLGTANGLSLLGQVLSLQLSSSTLTGALSSTDWNTFNNKQPAGSYVLTSSVGAANGVAPLDSGGKVPFANLPSSIMTYQGTWDPSTNTPLLADGTGTNGNVYWVSALFAGPVSGLNNASMVNFQIGDIVIYSSALGQWELTTPAAGVSSVNGTQGAVTVNAINQLTGDVTAGPASGSQSKVASLVAITNSTLTTLSALSLPGAQVTGNIAGNAGNITASSNSTLTSLPSLVLPASQISGQLSIGNGGTGQSTALAAFNALSPLTTKGDLLTHNGTNNVREPVGTDGFVLVADSAQTNGIKWTAPSTGNAYFIGTPNNSDGSTSSLTYATFSSGPLLTFTPTVSGDYKVYGSLTLQNTVATSLWGVKISATSGSPTIVAEQDSVYNQPITNGAVNANPYSIYTLVAGNSYTFEPQGYITGVATLTLKGSVTLNGHYIVAELLA